MVSVADIHMSHILHGQRCRIGGRQRLTLGPWDGRRGSGHLGPWDGRQDFLCAAGVTPATAGFMCANSIRIGASLCSSIPMSSMITPALPASSPSHGAIKLEQVVHQSGPLPPPTFKAARFDKPRESAALNWDLQRLQPATAC